MSELASFPSPNLSDYDDFYNQFNWQIISYQLSGLPDGKGLNIAHEAIDRHDRI
jgi:acetyl-CoA synthetase